MTLAIIQARMGSCRLPGKVLADVAGRPLLWYVVRRAQLAKLVDQVVVAIPDTVADLEIAQLCAAWDVPCVAGPEHDVLARYLLVAGHWQPTPDVIVRITGDCPLIDPGVIDMVVAACRTPDRGYAYASNVFPFRTFPDGLDVEAFPLSTLEQLEALASHPLDREHATSYLHRCPQEFPGGMACPKLRPRELGHLRWTVDTELDLAFVREVFEFLTPHGWATPMTEILARVPFAHRTALA